MWKNPQLGFLKWTLLPKTLTLSSVYLLYSTVQLCGTVFRGNYTYGSDLRNDRFSHWAIVDMMKPVLTGWAVVALQVSSDIFTLWAKGHATEEEDKASEEKKGCRKIGQKGSSPFGVLEALPFYQLCSSFIPCTNLVSGCDKKREQYGLSTAEKTTRRGGSEWALGCTLFIHVLLVYVKPPCMKWYGIVQGLARRWVWFLNLRLVGIMFATAP